MYPILILLLVCFAAFVIIMAIYVVRDVGQFIVGKWVPFVPTREPKIQALIEYLRVTHMKSFIDIGCGDGRICRAVDEAFPEVNVTGIEISKRLRKQAQGGTSDLPWKLVGWNYLDIPWKDYDVVYTYMMPLHMKNIWKKFQNECHTWALLISNEFPIKWAPIKDLLDIDPSSKGAKIYIYQK